MAKVPLRVYNREIETMVDRGLLDEAVAHCRHILKTFPKHLETYRLLGKALLEYKRYPDAADIFSRVLVSIPSDFVSNVGMSIIRDEENKLDDAIWHMERAFETQPSNAAIQSELQRLYGRRDGVQPPRIRMTRGALAHMYVQGELYPQAISEIKSVLKEDPGRNDMQVLLARAYYKSGLKNDAAEVASAVLRTYPYCLDANRVLVDILGVDHPESVQTYRQRVIELDPYASQITSSIFLSEEVPDAAITLERLDWNGQPVGMQPGWEATQAISLESGQRQEEQPDWLKGAFGETPASSASAPVPAFDAAAPSAKPAEPIDEIPDFLREAGWGKSTGAFDESKSAFEAAEHEPMGTQQPIEQGELPDWVKAMAPQESEETPAEGEELPDWINKIGTSALPVQSNDQPDWMSQLEQPAEDQPAAPSSEEPDWLKGFSSEAEPTPSASGASTEELDWLNQLSEQSKSKAAEASTDEFDFLKEFGNQPEPTSTAPSVEEFDFLNPLGSQTPAAEPAEEFDFLNEFKEETEQLPPSSAPSMMEPSTSAAPGVSEEEQEDAFAWLESLAAKQGATEGLLTKPEDRLEEEPDWVKQAKGIDASATQPPAEQVEQPPVSQPTGNLEELGKSEQEFDDSFAWLESLAAKQGAIEGLLTKPEDRLEEEPEWIRQAKSLSGQAQETPITQTPEEEKPSPVEEPSATLEELGKPEQERDDSFAWLESLAEKQGATEGLLTEPEERPQEEPDWIKQAKDLEAQELSAKEPVNEQPAAMDDTAVWLQSLEEEAMPAPEPTSRNDDTAIWLKSLEEEPQEVAPEPTQTMQPEELPAWMQSIEEESPIESVTSEASEAPDTSEWIASLEEQPAAQEPPKVDTGSLPSWLRGLEKEEAQESVFAADEDLPAWLRDETGDAIAEPTKIEPTRATDWQPVETEAKPPKPEVVTPEVPEPAVSQPEPEPEVASPAAAGPIAEPPQPEPVDVVAIIEEKLVAAEQEPEKPEPLPRPYKELPVRKVTGGLTDPILGQARSELSRNNVSGALDNYGRLIKKGRFLEDIIYDLREASYRYPVEVNIWQFLGDAYMRANRLQDALDAYTKAEELLR